MKPKSTLLPAAVTRYLAAANQFNALVAADCFTSDATVHDENQDHIGRGALRVCVAETSEKYRPRFTLMRTAVQGDEVRLAVAIAGQFPGSPVTLDYQLRLQN